LLLKIFFKNLFSSLTCGTFLTNLLAQFQVSDCIVNNDTCILMNELRKLFSDCWFVCIYVWNWTNSWLINMPCGYILLLPSLLVVYWCAVVCQWHWSVPKWQSISVFSQLTLMVFGSTSIVCCNISFELCDCCSCCFSLYILSRVFMHVYYYSLFRMSSFCSRLCCL
jgi:hypothetical protein